MGVRDVIWDRDRILHKPTIRPWKHRLARTGVASGTRGCGWGIGVRVVIVAAALVSGARGQEAGNAESLVVVPLHVHVLKAEGMEDIDCVLSDADLDRIVAKVNQVWRPAGVYFREASRRRETAAGLEAYRALRERLGEREMPLGRYRRLVPRETLTDDGLHVYYVHRLPVNGVYLGQRVAMVQETAALREVAGGIDEPLPRVTSHEIGHALGLPHRQDRTNLMASGTTGTSLNEAEVEKAHGDAAEVPGARSLDGIRSQARLARERGDESEAIEMEAFLEELGRDGG